MRRYYTVSGILLILPTIDFAGAAPVLVQDKRQSGVDVVHIPEGAITVLGKRGDDLSKVFLMFEDHFAAPEESSAAHPSSTESGHQSPEVHAPVSAQVFPTWFHPDHADYGLMGAHPSLGPSNLRPSTEIEDDHRSAVEESPSKPASSTENQVVHPPPPSPGSASPTESDHEMADVPPSSPVSLTNPDRQAKGSRRNSGTARDVGNAAQSELQRERSLDPGDLTVGNLDNFKYSHDQ